ncbi:hypothetical protein HY339_01940 [Candidatus Gottesmanbacteria bacterium]|nr:hypothetical protein [Candidatus Gottesmanbacteria bacterium]
MKLFLKTLFVLILFSASVFAGKISAQTRLVYPIPELGYCRDAKECSLYCEIPQNKAACWSYGKYKVGNDVLGVTTMNEEEKRMMEEKAKQYNITFPIADLGNCAGPQECRDFCEQPANQQVCMDFAKKKGLQKETKDELLQKAKTELGCTSMESCSQICQTDQSRCESFARKHGVYQEPPESRGRYSAEEKMQLMQKAQSELGCTSMETCKSTCEQNPERCMAFAKKHGFDKEQEERPSPTYGTQRFGSERLPAGRQGCDSEESCKTYCQEHPDECPGFQGYTRATQEGSYMSPSGCRTEAECKNWCNDHPDKCPGFSEGKAREESGGGSPSYPSPGTYSPPITLPAAP